MSGPFSTGPRRTPSGARPQSAHRNAPSPQAQLQSLVQAANRRAGSIGDEEQRQQNVGGREVRSRWSGDNLKIDFKLGGPTHQSQPSFFVPSYLRGSRYVDRLLADRKARLAAVEEGKDAQGHRGSRNASGSHKGVAQDVVERAPPAGLLSGAHSSSDESEPARGLPSRWNEDDKWTGLDITGDGSEVKFSGVCKTSDDAASIRANHPMPKECGIYYFEVTILSRCKEGLIGIGFSGKKTPLNRLPGWEAESFAYHGDDGFSFSCSANGKPFGPKFQSQDVIGCGVNFLTGSAFFTKNGTFLSPAFQNLPDVDLYPSIGVKKSGEHLSANFGRSKFVFDIDGMMAETRSLVSKEINRADVSSLHPPDSEDALLQKLVGQYFAHEGYVEASKAFASDVKDRAKALSTHASVPELGGEDDAQALNRQQIRRAILDGDIDKAFKYTQTYYPTVLQDARNKDIYFQLRCRKFIEMMRRYSELQVASASDPASNDSFDSQMEVDDQLNRENPKQQQQQQGEDVDMETSTSSLLKSGLMKANDYLAAALQYGQELQAEFDTDPSPTIQEQLPQIFAILAYIDPRESIVGGLLDKSGREGIAEAVNGAILVSLGKPSSAALENLCEQTESYLDDVASKAGGKAGVVNIRRDFLKKAEHSASAF